jgi:hypothetical protein
LPPRTPAAQKIEGKRSGTVLYFTAVSGENSAFCSGSILIGNSNPNQTDWFGFAASAWAGNPCCCNSQISTCQRPSPFRHGAGDFFAYGTLPLD